MSADEPAELVNPDYLDRYQAAQLAAYIAAVHAELASCRAQSATLAERIATLESEMRDGRT